jgi:ketosteroid isomerase-like protein
MHLYCPDAKLLIPRAITDSFKSPAILWVSCETMNANKKTEADVRAVLERMLDAYRTKDLDGVMSCYAPDPDLVSIGTGRDEKTLGPGPLRRQYERDFAQSESVAMTFDWLSVSANAAGSVAWVASDATVHAKVRGEEMTFQGRLTGVLENRKGTWLIVQVHFSLPAAEQPAGESFPEPRT